MSFCFLRAALEEAMCIASLHSNTVTNSGSFIETILSLVNYFYLLNVNFN